MREGNDLEDVSVERGIIKRDFQELEGIHLAKYSVQ